MRDAARAQRTEFRPPPGQGSEHRPGWPGSLSCQLAVRALVAASEGRVRVRLVCDLSQAKGKTKMQLQVLQKLATGGHSFGYGEIGSGLQSLHHAKSVLVLRASSAAGLVAGSTNWTTSSRANRECGVFLKFTSSRAVSLYVIGLQTSTQRMIQASRCKLRSRVGTRQWLAEQPRQTPATSSA